MSPLLLQLSGVVSGCSPKCAPHVMKEQGVVRENEEGFSFGLGN